MVTDLPTIWHLAINVVFKEQFQLNFNSLVVLITDVNYSLCFHWTGKTFQFLLQFLILLINSAY